MTRLIISPHVDDEVLGIGGTMAKLSTKDDFYIVEVTHCEKERKAEFNQALSFLSNVTHVEWLGFKDGGITTNHIPQMARAISHIIADVKPTHVYIPYKSLHQDHQMVNHASLVALRSFYGSVLEYEYVEGMSQFHSMEPNYFEQLSEQDIHDKCEMIECFKSQVGYLRDSESLRALSVVRGFSAGSGFAEGFRLVRGIF